MPEHEFGWHDAFAEHSLRTVDVGEQGVEHPGPLIDAHLEPGPLGVGDHQRDRVEHPRPLFTGFLVLHGVRDTIVADQAAGLLPPLREFRGLPRAELVDEPAPVWPRQAVGTAEFVVTALRGLVAGERILPPTMRRSGRKRSRGGVEQGIHIDGMRTRRRTSPGSLPRGVGVRLKKGQPTERWEEREALRCGRRRFGCPRSPERKRWVCGWCGAGWGGGRIPRACAWGFLAGRHTSSRS